MVVTEMRVVLVREKKEWDTCLLLKLFESPLFEVDLTFLILGKNHIGWMTF